MFQFNRVGYFSNVNRLSVRYAMGAKNKPENFDYSSLMDMDSMQAFLDEKNEALTKEMNEKFGDRFESVGYSVRVSSDGLVPQLQMISKGVLSKDEMEEYETYLESYQKSFAKEFNKQPFTETETGFAKFSSKNKFGIDLKHSDKLVPNQMISVNENLPDHCTKIVVYPDFISGWDYIFSFENDSYPDVYSTLFYRKDGCVRESKDPIMVNVRASLEEVGVFDSVDEIDIFSNSSIHMNTSGFDDETVLQIADKLATCMADLSAGKRPDLALSEDDLAGLTDTDALEQ